MTVSFWHDERVQILRDGYTEGKTARELASKLGTSPAAIRRHAARMGIRWMPRYEWNHGLFGYQKKNCRCETCSAAVREHRRLLKTRTAPSHGYSGYVNYGCRCGVCSAAMSNYNRRNYLRRTVRVSI